MSEFVQGTPNPTEPTHDELEAIFHTENGMSLLVIWRAGRVAGLEEAATIADMKLKHMSDPFYGPNGLSIASRIRARLGDTGTENQDA